MFMNLGSLLLKNAMSQNYQGEFNGVTKFYGSDINKDLLEAQFWINHKLQMKKVTLNISDEFVKDQGHGIYIH